MACPHLDTLARLPPPTPAQTVHREECVQCFDSQDSNEGIDVCLSCFSAGCLSLTRQHAQKHFAATGHGFTLNIKRRPKASSSREDSGEPPAKMTKLAIQEEREADKFEWLKGVKCWACEAGGGREVQSSDPRVTALVEGVMHSLSSGLAHEVKAWEEEITPCEHTLMLQQLATGPISDAGLAQCASCPLTSNLWLCLTCGSLACGRAQHGSPLSGNGHALAHHAATGHSVNVKLGTITAEGNADVYCYSCDDAKTDPELGAHLANFGIRVEGRQRTERSLTELQIEQNLKYDFSLTGEDGKALEPVFGPGLTGLANLGNSCYMASALQALFSLPAFKQRYYGEGAQGHGESCERPAECVECQMRKVADGLLSGRYSVPAPSNKPSNKETEEDNGPTFQAGLKPSDFKALVGRGHAEFSTMRQQDAEEFFSHLISVLRRDGRKRDYPDATQVFAYGMEQRLQCAECAGVRYRVDDMDVLSVPVPAVRVPPSTDSSSSSTEPSAPQYEPVPLTSCISTLLGEELVPDYACEACKRPTNARKGSKFAGFPEVLVVQARKFQLVGWVPTKLDIPVLLPEGDVLEFTQAHLGTGLQPGETALPSSSTSQSTSAALPTFDAGAMSQLTAMGFPEIRAQRALLATGNGADAEGAMMWLLEHLEDPDIDDPIQPTGGASTGVQISDEQVSALVEMGFTPAQGRKALRETGGNAERAVEWLFSHPDDNGEEDVAMADANPQPQNKETKGTTEVPVKYRLKAFVSHKGPSVHSGHYVAHVKVDDSWVLFNDEKVVKADEGVEELKRLAYMYVFERI